MTEVTQMMPSEDVQKLINVINRIIFTAPKQRYSVMQ